ncbi:MAG: nucleotidyl transferase AbiEii/AbiGii toxin family protein [Coriobacteriales bacterium]|jgi:predicted nucleotidyltransferase component of viral defense system|nr:nucleotidyl transferase AbiEii/AbiGii toxin family protein [Coriobacteriales bacterium]
MPNNLLEQMLARYEIQTANDQKNALREVMQQITLSGLNRAGFFDVAAFYGGTCLRIFQGLPRASEDMDFSLLAVDKDFLLERYFDSIIDEFKIIGHDVNITQKGKKAATNIESALLKDDTVIYDLRFDALPKIKIKIEVDTTPPQEFSTEYRLLMLPYSFMVRCYSLPDSYAGKMHALLFRNWQSRVKGRDWYDFEWYIRNDVPLSFRHFCQRAYQFGQIAEGAMTKELFGQLLREKITQTSLESVKADVLPFVKDSSALDIWSTDYFLELARRIRFA